MPRCRTESYALNVMDKEQLPVLLVLELAKDHSQARYSVTVKNAVELDGVVARSAAVLARSNQQIQNSSFSVMGLAAHARMKSLREHPFLPLAPTAFAARSRISLTGRGVVVAANACAELCAGRSMRWTCFYRNADRN